MDRFVPVRTVAHPAIEEQLRPSKSSSEKQLRGAAAKSCSEKLLRAICSHMSQADPRQAWVNGDVPEIAPECPVPSSRCEAAPAVRPGPTRLVELMQRFIERSGLVSAHLIAQWIRGFGEYKVATMCSGTDMPIICWQALTAAIRKTCDTDITVTHSFSSEKKHCQTKVHSSTVPTAPSFVSRLHTIMERPGFQCHKRQNCGCT